jgi:membrane-associated phospholipid phosphatase
VEFPVVTRKTEAVAGSRVHVSTPQHSSEGTTGSEPRGSFGFSVLLAVGMTAAAVIIAVAYHLPLRDPDSVAGPTYVRLPAILALVFLVDVIPRAIRRAGTLAELRLTFREVVRERWHLEHLRFILFGLGSWYLTYVAFRDLKSYVPFVRKGLWDHRLERLDQALLLGNDPATLLHQVLGTNWSAHFLSGVYIAWIVFVPASLAATLVWSRNVMAASWYVTAVSVDWVLGVVLYYLVPTVGPIYARPGLFSNLVATASSKLQELMWDERQEMLAHPFQSNEVQTIAAFASLHVGIMVTACVIAHLLELNRLVRLALWTFMFLTVLATVYLGWHYFVDVIGGAALGFTAAFIAAKATGNPFRRVRRTPPVALSAPGS